MFDLWLYLLGLTLVIGAAFLTWLLSVYLRNVAIVDTLWSVLFALLAWTYALGQTQLGPRAEWVLLLVTLWALRLSIHITRRNWGHPEDRRYQAIRARNEPHFALKSLYLVFVLQALLAWFISLPLLGAIASREAFTGLDYAGGALWLIGFVFEAGGDWQLARFKATPGNEDKVMDRGFWALTRHPNYFGDFCVWWGLYLAALSAGAWWSLPGPLLMSILLLRFSGVALLEKDIAERRPQYAEYMRRTNAFFPGPRKPA